MQFLHDYEKNLMFGFIRKLVSNVVLLNKNHNTEKTIVFLLNNFQRKIYKCLVTGSYKFNLFKYTVLENFSSSLLFIDHSIFILSKKNSN